MFQQQGVFLIVFSVFFIVIVSACGPAEPVPPTPKLTSDSVAILVVDDFQNFTPPSPEDLDKKEYGGENCAVNPIGQGYFDADGLGYFDADGLGYFDADGLSHPNYYGSHGELVFAELKELINSQVSQNSKKINKATYPNYQSNVVKDIITWELNQKHLLLVGVDTDGYTTSAITTNIITAIEFVESIRPNTKYVLNLSFGIIPCESLSCSEYVEKIENASQPGEELPGLDNLHQLFAKYLGETDIADISNEEYCRSLPARFIIEYSHIAAKWPSILELKEGLSNNKDQYDEWLAFESDPFWRPIDPDPLYMWIANPKVDNSSVTAISIAASGNSDFSYPLLPALWSNVLSVSASDATMTLAEYSNDGEVVADGRHPTEVIINPDPNISFVSPGDPLPGTSFATPRASLQTALYLLHDGDIACGQTPGQTLPVPPPPPPPLAYAPGWDLWKNYSCVDASQNYCPNSNFPCPFPPFP